MGNDLDKSRGIAADRFDRLVVLVIELTRSIVQVFRFYFVLVLLSFFASRALAESDEVSVPSMPYKYIEWIEADYTNAPEDIQNLIIVYLRELYEDALEFAKEAPLYTPSVLYIPLDLNGDGRQDIIGQLYSGYLCTRHAGCPTVVLIKRDDGSYVESINDRILGRWGVTDNGILVNEVRDIDYYRCDMYMLDERGYFNLQSGECTGDD